MATAKEAYNKFRKAHGQVVVPTPFPAMHGDTLEDLPEFTDLTAAEQNGWTAVAKAAPKAKATK
jgi:hypothetical protein